jgi:hypothetical protein
VDVQAAALLLDLDVFVTALKAKYAAPEILAVMDPAHASRFAVALRATGFSVSLVPGTRLIDLPWPDPVTTFALDESCFRATMRNESVEIPYDAEVVAVYCQPPANFSMKPSVDLRQAVASGHGPMIAEAIQWRSNVDLYFHDWSALRRVSIVPDLVDLSGDQVAHDLERRFKRLRLDVRLSGVRPRGRCEPTEAPPAEGSRRGYSFGTAALAHLLRSISPELSEMTQYELGSRLAVALSPLGKTADRN